MFGSIVVGGGLYLLGRLLGGERRRILGMLCRVSALCVSEYLGVSWSIGCCDGESWSWRKFAVERSGERGNPAIWECLLFPIE